MTDNAHACPHCKTRTLERSRRRWYERWRNIFTGRRPYRCFACRQRFWL